ncbi:hypothetical protein V3Q90_02040 [Flavobacterium oreochromis]|uniref:hypothetical protein n=1 Tax=Flavobacterium oreochromis TaxID=2906078 RepID=UPI00385FE472
MTAQEKRRLGQEKHKLLRYQAVLEEFKQYDNGDIPMTTIHRKYIYPKFFISMTTLYTILSTPVAKRLKELEQI